MKEELLNLIKCKPKHYVKLVLKNPSMLEWVLTNSLIDSAHLPSMIFSALYQESNICKNGNIKKFDRISTGFIGCGLANNCKCTLENISKNVSKTKEHTPSEKKQLANTKRKETMIQKYGVEFNSQRNDMKDIWKRPKISPVIHEKLSNQAWLDNEYNIKKRSLSEIAYELGIDYTTVSSYCKKFNFTIRPSSMRSVEECEIVSFINDLGFTTDISNRTLISPKELDILIPRANLSIELNGLWWHSYHPELGIPEDRYRHLNKTISVNNAGYSLMHITDFDWHTKKPIIKSMIKSRLGINSRIHGRKCVIREIDKETEKDFLNTYHIQGFISSYIAFGLFLADDLIMMMSIGKSRYNSAYDYEILRMCTKSDITVIGGVSKLVSYLKGKLPNSVIVSYCDFSKGNGQGYLAAGFTKEGISQPGYCWTNGDIIISRYKTQKHNLSSFLPSFDASLSESKNMFNAKYRRYWDCGNIIFTIKT